ncbi:hypothetical protein PN490_03875, partial [Nodularia spumigena CS-588/01]|nr:hypothetical protein [Nodularia spumigena CS-588/01]
MLSYKKLQQQICRFRMSADILFIQQPPRRLGYKRIIKLRHQKRFNPLPTPHSPHTPHTPHSPL